jgi:hypothetical protein
MRTTTVFLAGALVAAMSASAQQAVPPELAVVPDMPTQASRIGRRVNRVIDMWR